MVDADEVRVVQIGVTVDVAVVPQVDVDELCDLPGAVGQLRYRLSCRHRFERRHRSIGLADVEVVPAQELSAVGDHEREQVERNVAEILLRSNRVPVQQHVVGPRQGFDSDRRVAGVWPDERGRRRQEFVGSAPPHPERPVVDADESVRQQRSGRSEVAPSTSVSEAPTKGQVRGGPTEGRPLCVQVVDRLARLRVVVHRQSSDLLAGRADDAQVGLLVVIDEHDEAHEAQVVCPNGHQFQLDTERLTRRPLREHDVGEVLGPVFLTDVEAIPGDRDELGRRHVDEPLSITVHERSDPLLSDPPRGVGERVGGDGRRRFGEHQFVEACQAVAMIVDREQVGRQQDAVAVLDHQQVFPA